MNTNILIIDDEKSVLTAMRMVLEDRYRVFTAESGEKALQIQRSEQLDLVLLDIGLPDIDGLELLKRLKVESPELPVIMVTAVEKVKTVVKAVKSGAYDYLVKPVESRTLQLCIRHALENSVLKERIRIIEKTEKNRFKDIVTGRSPQMKDVLRIAKKVSQSPEIPVLITGETGTGKGIVARVIHYNRLDNPGPFITVNCGAIAKDLIESELFGYEKGAFTGADTKGKKGRFEEAAKGTLFLDEIGTMALAAQVKLLSVLEDRMFCRVGGSRRIEVSARIIAATNSDLESAVEKGLFRKDLYYRLNVVKIEIPPLRDRPGDIMPLTLSFMNRFNERFGRKFRTVSKEARQLMLRYPWPGNVRELSNHIERIVLLEEGDTILPDHLLTHLRDSVSFPSSDQTVRLPGTPTDFDTVVKELIQSALHRSDGNVMEASKLLNLPSHKLRYRMKKYGILKPNGRN